MPAPTFSRRTVTGAEGTTFYACGRCGRQVDVDWHYCAWCGAHVDLGIVIPRPRMPDEDEREGVA